MRRAAALSWIVLCVASCGGGGGVAGPADAAVGRADAAVPPADAAVPPADAAQADAAGGPCVADSPAALVACGAAVQAGSTDTIEVRGLLVCTGVDACKVRIENAPRPYVIRGARYPVGGVQAADGASDLGTDFDPYILQGAQPR